MEPEPWNAPLERLRDRLQEALGLRFNTALANLYRDGNDTVGWHADDEPELGDAPVIASISLGATRDFILRHRAQSELVQAISLDHGSMLVMEGETQDALAALRAASQAGSRAPPPTPAPKRDAPGVDGSSKAGRRRDARADLRHRRAGEPLRS